MLGAASVARRGALGIRSYSLSPVQNNNGGFMTRLRSFMGSLGRKTTIGQANAILHNIRFQASNEDWFEGGLVQRNFRGRHTLLLLYVWLMHTRVVMEGKPGMLVDEAMFDEVWEDTMARIRREGVAEISVNKYLREVQGYSFRLLSDLDKIIDLANAEPTADLLTKHVGDSTIVFSSIQHLMEDSIAGLLWKTLYAEDKSVPEAHTLKLARYILKEHKSLVSLPKESVFTGRIQWSTLPWMAIEAEGDSEDIRRRTEERARIGEWREATSPDGRPYYWHTVTRKTTWEKPADM